MRLPPYLPAAYPYPAIELKGNNMAENEGKVTRYVEQDGIWTIKAAA
jgi:hypothetical protein